MRQILAAFAAVVWCGIAHAEWQGQIVGIKDGDTVVLLRDRRELLLRLYGIDCPEKTQAFGSRAQQAVSELVFGKEVSVDSVDTDRYGRTVALVTIDGRTVSEALVATGYAWVYEQYCHRPECESWRGLEAKARGERRGLWADAQPTPPWEYRRGGNRTPTVAAGEASAAVDQQAGSPATSATTAVYVTKTGKRYHLDGCRFLARSKIPMALAQAVARYTPCSVCKPPSLAAEGKAATGATVTPTPAPAVITGQCQAITKKGTQCTRKAKPGSSYCSQHGGK
ncbi:MAG: thermonuclease family protein [Candidatus Latescibacterota bacterium]|jgi:endonuclease YncB( thermonuclease family)